MELRPIEPDDGEALHAIFAEPEVLRFLFDDVAPARHETQRHVEAARDHGGWAVCDDGEIVGLVSLRPAGGERELMIVLSRRCWGRGIAFAAAQVAMRHGFDVLKLERILASVDLPNERSHRLMRRLGFEVTGESAGPKYRLRTYEKRAG